MYLRFTIAVVISEATETAIESSIRKLDMALYEPPPTGHSKIRQWRLWHKISRCAAKDVPSRPMCTKCTYFTAMIVIDCTCTSGKPFYIGCIVSNNSLSLTDNTFTRIYLSS